MISKEASMKISSHTIDFKGDRVGAKMTQISNWHIVISKAAFEIANCSEQELNTIVV